MRYLPVFFCIFACVAANPLPKRTQYNEQYAKQLLNLAAGAYSLTPEVCVNRTLPQAHQWKLYTSSLQRCDAYSSSCSYYIVISNSTREVIVVFRGTKTKKQLFIEGWQSLQPGLDFFGVGKVNRYFFHALGTLWAGIEPVLADPAYKNYHVTFTGHSLGGALASLGAIRTVLDGHRPSNQIKLYTFGQPRVGTAQFAAKHDELVPHSFRVVHRLDIVPHMPACDKTLDDPRVEPKDDSKPCDPHGDKAYHHGTEIWYPQGMGPGAQYFECLGTPKNEDFDCSDSLSFELSKYETYIADHRHYFDHKVPSYGKLGCEPNSPIEETLPMDAAGPLGASPGASSTSEPGRFHSIARKLKTVGRFLGIGS
ncbi:Lipase family protein [Aphelenchoides avenae]|nr:Lipase family protein [Aphelenchus avenae]